MTAAPTTDRFLIWMKGKMLNHARLRLLRRSALIATVLAVTSLTTASAASAAVEWQSEVIQAPASLPPSGRGIVEIIPSNAGDTTSTGLPSINFDLPEGVTVGSPPPQFGWACTGASNVTCTNLFGGFMNALPATYAGFAPLFVVVDVAADAPGGAFPFAVTMDGAGGAEVTQTHELRVGGGSSEFGPTPGSFEAGSFDENGNPYTQAGGHPYQATTAFKINTKYVEVDESDPGSFLRSVQGAGKARDVVVDLPAGFAGDPGVGPKCPDLLHVFEANCPDASQVGFASISPPANTAGRQRMLGVYNVEAPKDAPALFAFRSTLGTVILRPTVRSDGDYGLRVSVRNITQADILFSSEVTLWGAPADPVHDAQRCAIPNFVAQACVGYDESGNDNETPDRHTPHSSSSPIRPFLTNPTRCTGEPELSRLHLSSWEEPGAFNDDGSPELTDPNWRPATAEAPALSGCENLAFDPRIDVRTTTTQADSPTGLEVEIETPQNDDPNGLATPHLKDVRLVLPEGMSINPASANGLGSCSPAQIGLTTPAGAEPRFDTARGSCPLTSKIGSVEVETPLLDDPLKGSVFVAQQKDNPFGSLFALYFEIEGPGVRIKLAGEVDTDPSSGRIETVFLNNPQLPFDVMRVKLKGGARAPLAMPATCGTGMAEAEFVSWADPHIDSVDVEEPIAVTEGPNGKPCAPTLAERPFDPTMAAGLTNPVAGSQSPFIFRLTREDGDQEILSTEVTPPQGLTAKLAGVPLCTNQQANQGNCPASSQVGSVVAGAGAGPTPFYIQGADAGKVFMTDAYKGEQLGMLIEVPAKAGPFDLGTVNVRAAVAVDKRTAQLTVKSDPIPQILEGIPLRTRDIRVKIDRPDFTIAPTNCDPMEVKATATGSHGATANLTNRFQVGDCASLGFHPNLDLSFGKSKKDTKANSHPPLNAKLSFNEGDSNISSVEVALPQGLFLDQDRLGRICSRANYAAETCPAESQVGYAKATTPLLDKPVEGPVYLKASDNPLPDLAADLNGQIDVDLFGKIDQKQNKKGLNQIRNTFDIVPDVPVSDFELKLDGGSDGLLVNSRNICKSKKAQRLSIDIQAHNEMTLSERPLVGSACQKINKKKASKLKAKAKKLLKKAKKADNAKKAKTLRKQARKLKKQARKLGR